jgi:predicted N-acetyltransferase YhbS
MKSDNWFIRLEEAADSAEIESIQAAAFGPGRFVRTAFRIREGFPHDPSLSFVGLSGQAVAGSVRLTQIMIGERPSLLLGPLTVAPEFKNRGLGKKLLRVAIDAAGKQGETAILLVGDAPYYSPFGFQQVPMGSVELPGPVDPARVLIAPLNGAARPTGVVAGGRF